MHVGHRFSSWSCTDGSAWQYIKVVYVYVWRQGSGPHIHTDIQVFIHTHTGNGSYKTFCPWMLLHTLLWLSPSPCCHPAVVPSTHYLVSCDSSSESVGPEEPRGGKTKASQLPLNSNDRETEQKQSPCPSTDYIRNSRDVNHALISSVLQRRLHCGKIAAVCEAAFVGICKHAPVRACVRLCSHSINSAVI